MRFSTLSVGGLRGPLDSAARTMQISLLMRMVGKSIQQALCMQWNRKDLSLTALVTPFHITSFLMHKCDWAWVVLHGFAPIPQHGSPELFNTHWTEPPCSSARLYIYLATAETKQQIFSLNLMVESIWHQPQWSKWTPQYCTLPERETRGALIYCAC